MILATVRLVVARMARPRAATSSETGASVSKTAISIQEQEWQADVGHVHHPSGGHRRARPSRPMPMRGGSAQGSLAMWTFRLLGPRVRVLGFRLLGFSGLLGVSECFRRSGCSRCFGCFNLVSNIIVNSSFTNNDTKIAKNINNY